MCSGAGKSTVAALLSRFYAPDGGDILLNGQPASSFTRGEWARAISIVQQEPVLFGGRDHLPDTCVYSVNKFQQLTRKLFQMFNSYIQCELNEWNTLQERSCFEENTSVGSEVLRVLGDCTEQRIVPK